MKTFHSLLILQCFHLCDVFLKYKQYSIVCISGFFVTEFVFFIYIFLVVIYYIFHLSVYCLPSIRLCLVWVLPASLSSCFILAVVVMCLMWSLTSRWLIRLIIFSCSPTCFPLIIHECIYCLGLPLIILLHFLSWLCVFSPILRFLLFRFLAPTLQMFCNVCSLVN